MSNTVPVATVEPSVTMRLTIPAQLYKQLVELEGAGANLEEVVVGAIGVGLVLGEMAYMIDKAGDAEIRRLLGGRVDGQAKLLDMLRRLVSLHVGGHRVELRPAVLEQIAWAAKSLCKPVEEVAPQMIADAVSEKFRA